MRQNVVKNKSTHHNNVDKEYALKHFPNLRHPKKNKNLLPAT